MSQYNLNTKLRVLITNNTLASRAGTELYVRDIALALLKRGYSPIAYSSVLGDVAEEIRAATIPVVDDLNALNVAPDLIHGQHHLDAVTAMLHFPRVPTLYFCHGWLPWEEMPPVMPSIMRYVAVDDLCRERLLTSPGVQPEKTRTLYNFVDLARFTPRAPLPPKPRSALIFSNTASENNFVKIIRAACQRFGIERIDVAGMGSGNSVARPEQLLPAYDIVFAKARCALEAMAVGCAVIVADISGIGGMVTSKNMAELRRLNFGIRTMQTAFLTEDVVYAELERYYASDAAEVSAWIRKEACLERAVDTLEEYYRDALAQSAAIADISTETWASAASNYLRAVAPTIKPREEIYQRAVQTENFARQIGYVKNSVPNFSASVLVRDLMVLMLPPLARQTDDTLAGIDHVESLGSRVRVIGWVCDGRNGRGCSIVLAMVNGRIVGSAPVDRWRPDVQQQLNLVDERAGFELLLESVPHEAVLLVAVTVEGRIFQIGEGRFQISDAPSGS